jgi:hypothetical protein
LSKRMLTSSGSTLFLMGLKPAIQLRSSQIPFG